MFMIRPSRLGKRGERVVTIVGRDAMDASGVARRAVPSAYGKGVWSWHPWAGVKPRETFREATVTSKVMDTGESTQISRRTIAQGMPMLWLLL